MVDVRNVRIAHLNTNVEVPHLPNTTWLLHSCYIYREWLIEALHLGRRLGFTIKINEQSTKEVMNDFEHQIKCAHLAL